jgi:hypothetical protein
MLELRRRQPRDRDAHAGQRRLMLGVRSVRPASGTCRRRPGHRRSGWEHREGWKLTQPEEVRRCFTTCGAFLPPLPRRQWCPSTCFRRVHGRQRCSGAATGRGDTEGPCGRRAGKPLPARVHSARRRRPLPPSPANPRQKACQGNAAGVRRLVLYRWLLQHRSRPRRGADRHHPRAGLCHGA